MSSGNGEEISLAEAERVDRESAKDVVSNKVLHTKVRGPVHLRHVQRVNAAIGLTNGMRVRMTARKIYR